MLGLAPGARRGGPRPQGPAVAAHGAFERLRPRIGGIARDKFSAAPETSCVIEVLAADLAAGLDIDPVRLAALRRRAGEC
jgi:hypothetical protein